MAGKAAQVAVSGVGNDRIQTRKCKTEAMKESHKDIAAAAPADLDGLPTLRGFRLRGLEMTRLETFIDAAFAFAISMLVIAPQQIPDNIEAILGAFRNVPAFICSIAVLGLFWRGHWLWSRRYGLEDGISILISWAMIGTILIFVYPLKSIFGAMWFLLTNGAAGQQFSTHTTEAQVRAIFAIYALGLVAISTEVLLLYLRAWQLRNALRLNPKEKFITRVELSGWCIPVIVGIISLIFSYALPIEHIAWCGWIYFSMFVLFRIHGVWERRCLKATLDH